MEIDPWLVGLADLWDSLETECEHECCGIDAFNLARESVQRAVHAAHRHGVLRELSVVRQRIAALHPSAFIVSRRLNQYMHRDLILGLVDHLVECLHDRAQPNKA